MTKIDYSNVTYPIRPDLVDAHQRLLDHLSAAGTWWSGEQRRAIVEEVRVARDCTLCAERKAAVSPFAVDGIHDGPAILEPGVVDVVHRIVTDSGRLARSGYEKVIASGVLDPERYVELVSVTVLSNALDVFARAIGVEAQALPEAGPGEPSRERPASARVIDAWVPQIPSGSEGGGSDWTALYADRETVPQIGRALSLVPAEVEMLNSLSAAHYMHLDHVTDPGWVEPDRGLDRLQMELVAARVSVINECFY